MKNICITCVILISLINWSTALVHYVKLEKGANGCKFEGKELGVGESVKDPKTCGVYVCQNTDGDSLIHYCQQTAPFQNCGNSAVSTVTDFPQCCWMCVEYVSCGEKPTTAKPTITTTAGTPTTDSPPPPTPTAATEATRKG